LRQWLHAQNFILIHFAFQQRGLTCDRSESNHYGKTLQRGKEALWHLTLSINLALVGKYSFGQKELCG
jgi:hypothetical protein